MKGSRSISLIFTLILLTCDLSTSIHVPNFILQGIQKDLFTRPTPGSEGDQLMERAESISLKYCVPATVNSLVIQQVDDCLHAASGLVSYLDFKN